MGKICKETDFDILLIDICINASKAAEIPSTFISL